MAQAMDWIWLPLYFVGTGTFGAAIGYAVGYWHASRFVRKCMDKWIQ